MNAIAEVEKKPLEADKLQLQFQIHRVPFFLEGEMDSKDESDTELHMERMYRKFGQVRHNVLLFLALCD